MTADMQSTASVIPAAAPPARQGTRVGVVTSDKRDKTIRVTVSYMVRHPKYGKYIRRRTVLHAHDENNECRNGDQVEVVQCRPISKTKNWRLVRILQAAPRGEGGPTA